MTTLFVRSCLLWRGNSVTAGPRISREVEHWAIRLDRKRVSRNELIQQVRKIPPGHEAIRVPTRVWPARHDRRNVRCVHPKVIPALSAPALRDLPPLKNRVSDTKPLQVVADAQSERAGTDHNGVHEGSSITPPGSGLALLLRSVRSLASILGFPRQGRCIATMPRRRERAHHCPVIGSARLLHLEGACRRKHLPHRVRRQTYPFSAKSS